MDYFDKSETWSRDQIESEQVARLQKSINQAMKAKFYEKLYQEAGVSAQSIKTISDVQKIPLISKENLRQNYPTHLSCVPHDCFVRMHCSSGTTGASIAICYTQNDLNSWSSLMARAMYMTGIRKTDVFQNMSGYGLFTGGLGIHYGAEHLGCMTIPSGPGNTQRQIKLIRDFNVSAVHILPSYALLVAEHVKSQGLDPRELPLKIALVGAEPYTEETRKRIEEVLDIKVYNSFGMTEMNGPGVGMECQAQEGMHIWEDAYMVEIIDPDTGLVLPDGQVGELVMTTLSREGMPVLRYRTHDLTRIVTGECSCGRKHKRIDRIVGRSDDMFILKGVNIYPMQIEQVIMAFKEVGQNYLIQLEKDGLKEILRVKVEIRPENFVEDMRVLRALQEKIVYRLHSEILITPVVDLVQANSLPVSEGKAKRVIDLR